MRITKMGGGPGKMGRGEIRPGEIRPGEIRPGEFGRGEFGRTELGRGAKSVARSRGGRSAAAALAAASLAGALVVATGGAGSANAAVSTSSRSGVTASAASAASAKKGCAANGVGIPKGSAHKVVADLDGDGKKDTVWLHDQTSKSGVLTRTLGVRTASGAGFSRKFSDAGPFQAVAVANHLGDGSSVILLDFTRHTSLFAVKSCKIVPSLNVQGDQYNFDRELLTGYGTGVGCPVIGKTGRHLAGYKGTKNEKNKYWTVTRTTINLSDGGRQARNGHTVVLGRRLSASSAVVKRSQQVTCGGVPSVVEPVDA